MSLPDKEQFIRAQALAYAVTSCTGAVDRKYVMFHADNVLDVAVKYEEYITNGRAVDAGT